MPPENYENELELVSCFDCGEMTDSEESSFNLDGEAICDSCEAEYTDCSMCGEVTHNDNIFSTLNDGEVCDCCYEDHFIYCSDCGNNDNVDEATIIYNGESICSRCSQDYYCCDDCNEYYFIDNLWYTENGHYCEGCRDSNNNIHCWNYQPSFEPKRMEFEQSSKDLYGYELEIETRMSLADEIADDFNPHAYFKEDGSIDGFEIVTHPATLEWTKNNFDWRSKLDLLAKNGATSHNAGNAGLHVHINRKALRPVDWWKFARFFGKLNDKIMRFSMRKESAMQQWCRLSDDSEVKQLAIGRQLQTEYPRVNERYVALNFTSFGTVEVRIFRGTLHRERFLATIAFVDSLVWFCREYGYAFFARSNGRQLWEEYIRYIRRQGRYNHLAKYLLDKKLYRVRNCTKEQNRKETKVYY